MCLQKGTWPRKGVQVSGERERRTSGGGGGVLGNHTSAFLQSYTLAIIIIIGRCVVNRGRRLFALDALLDNKKKRKRLPKHELLLLGNAGAEIEGNR